MTASSMLRLSLLRLRSALLGFAALACQPTPGSASAAGSALGASDVVPPARAAASARGARASLDRGVPAAWSLPLSTAPVSAERFLVVSDSPLATGAGVTVLDAGGNAFDAAVAVALVLAVVYPEAGNLGGGGFAVVRDRTGRRAALDFRETAPERSHRDMYLSGRARRSDAALDGAHQRGADLARRAAPPEASPAGAEAASKEGHLSAGVPGSVAGLWALHQRFGSLPWPELIAPAIALARDGFVVDARLQQAVGDAAPKLARYDATRAWLLPAGDPPVEGQRITNADLAGTLERIAQRGPAGFYSGLTAELIAAEMDRGGGIVSLADLERYRPEWREPIEFEYRGHTLVSMPPPSSGGVALALIANIAKGDDLAGLGYHSPEHLHLLAEAMRRAFADRNALLGDPAFVRVPLGPLLSSSYAAERRRSITALATPSSQVGPGLPRPEGDHTTHLAVVDAEGAAVSLTTTINDFFGSGVTVSGAGFLLNDEMDDFTTDPGAPNLFGLVQGEANAIAPGKRMLSSMAPTLLLDPDGAVRAVAGARGGPRIITATWQVLSNIVDFGMNALEAVNAPRVHQQWQPDEIALERGGFTQAQTSELERRGHRLRSVPDLASSPVILRDPATDAWTGAADPRRGGEAAGR